MLCAYFRGTVPFSYVFANINDLLTSQNSVFFIPSHDCKKYGYKRILSMTPDDIPVCGGCPTVVNPDTKITETVSFFLRYFNV